MIEIVSLASSACKHQWKSFWTPPINSNNHAYLVSQRSVIEHSVIQPKIVFSLYISTRVTRRNTVKQL